jgi:hypothetical protein
MKKIFPGLPANYHKMKSGTQLYDVYDNLIRDHWREAFVSISWPSVPSQTQLIPSFFFFFFLSNTTNTIVLPLLPILLLIRPSFSSSSDFLTA